jgi:RNA polymerase sigma-70 factor (ECF subfamily)
MSDPTSARVPDTVRLTALMVAYQAGQFDAFDELYRMVSPVVRRYLLSQTRDAAKAEDLMQETFLQMHRARHTFDPAYPLMPWVMAIARHCWLMDRRTASRRPQASEDVSHHEPPVRPHAEALADQQAVRKALGQVAAARRQAIVAHHVWGLSFREIARRAGIAEAAAKLRSSRGMSQLRALLGGRGQRTRSRGQS